MNTKVVYMKQLKYAFQKSLIIHNFDSQLNMAKFTSFHIQWKHRWKPHVPWITYQNNAWFHLPSHWTSRFMDQNRTNWTQKQYFIIINHNSNYHLHCQFIFFCWQNFYITINFVNEQALKNENVLNFFLCICYTLECSLLATLIVSPQFLENENGFRYSLQKTLPSTLPHDLQQTKKFLQFDYF